MNLLADRIRTAREHAGLSQADIAKALRLSPSAVYQWEHGLTKDIRLTHFFALAKLLGRDPQWLATGQLIPRVRDSPLIQSAPESPPLTPADKTLLHQVHRLPGAVRKVLMKFLRGLGDTYISTDKSGR